MSSDDDVINGSIAITEADLVQGIAALSAYFRLRWFLVAMFVVMAVVLAASGMAGSGSQWAPSGGAFGFLCVWAFIAPKLTARKILRGLVKAGDNQVLYRFDADGGTVRASGSTTTFAYRVLTRVRESPTTLLLTVGTASTSIVPKRAFSPADLTRLQQLLAANVKTEELKGSRSALKIVLVWVALVFVFVVVWQFLNAAPPR
jgi:YcxB-like protein